MLDTELPIRAAETRLREFNFSFLNFRSSAFPSVAPAAGIEQEFKEITYRFFKEVP
jgi:hypothetical protein